MGIKKRTPKSRKRQSNKLLKFNFEKFHFRGSWLEKLHHPVPLNSEDCGYLVYLMSASDGKGQLYTGCTNSIQHRWRQHNALLAGGATACLKWVARQEQSEPVAILRGFRSRHDALCAELLIKKLAFKQFNHTVPQQYAKAKTADGKSLKTHIRKLLVAIQTKRWIKYPLQLCWFQRRLFRPTTCDVLLGPHSETDFVDLYSFKFDRIIQ